jgi:hypothetical protein
MEVQILNQSNILEYKVLIYINCSMRDHFPLLLYPKVMYSLPCMGLRLENYFGLRLMWRKYQESMSHMFFRLLTYSTEGHKKSKMTQYWG